MKIFLTGANGFLGSSLANRWIADGHHVVGLVRTAASLERLAPVRARMDFAVADELGDIAGCVADAAPDAIVHTACAYGRSGESTLQLFDVNLRLGVLLLEGAQRIASPAITFINTGTVLEPSVSPYALAKHQFVAWGHIAAERTPSTLRFLNVRLQHMYGPNDSPLKFSTHVIRACRDAAPRLELTSGVQRRDFVYIDDVVAAYSTLLSQAHRFAGFHDIEVGSGTAPTIRTFVETVHRLTGSRTALEFGAVALRSNEAMHCQADLSAMTALGWQPAFDLETGLRRTLELERNSPR